MEELTVLWSLCDTGSGQFHGLWFAATTIAGICHLSEVADPGAVVHDITLVNQAERVVTGSQASPLTWLIS
jgi:hypothetical protein